MGEALTAQLAISLAVSLNLSQVIIEGDSQTIIYALQDPSITQDIHLMPKEDPIWYIIGTGLHASTRKNPLNQARCLVKGKILLQNRPTEPREEAMTKTIKLLLRPRTGREKENTFSSKGRLHPKREENTHRKLQAKTTKKKNLGRRETGASLLLHAKTPSPCPLHSGIGNRQSAFFFFFFRTPFLTRYTT